MSESTAAQSTSQVKWWVIGCSGLTLLTLAMAVLFWFQVGRHISDDIQSMPRVVLNKEATRVEPSAKVSWAIAVPQVSILEVEVIERFGKRIEYEVYSNGELVGRSGVHEGRASGTHEVRGGTASLVVVNDNLLEGKGVIVSAKLIPEGESIWN